MEDRLTKLEQEIMEEEIARVLQLAEEDPGLQEVSLFHLRLLLESYPKHSMQVHQN